MSNGDVPEARHLRHKTTIQSLKRRLLKDSTAIATSASRTLPDLQPHPRDQAYDTSYLTLPTVGKRTLIGDNQATTPHRSCSELHEPPGSSTNLTRSASKTILDTIDRLEQLLNEAVKVAQVAAEIQDEATRTQNQIEDSWSANESLSKNPPSTLKHLKSVRMSAFERDASATTTVDDDVLQQKRPSSPEMLTQDSDRLQVEIPVRKSSEPSGLGLQVNTFHQTSESREETGIKDQLRQRMSPLRDVSPRISSRTLIPTPTPDKNGSSVQPSSDGRGLTSRCSDTRAVDSRQTAAPPPTIQVNGEDVVDLLSSEFSVPVFANLRQSGDFTQMFGIGPRHESIRLAHPNCRRSTNLRTQKQVDFLGQNDDFDMHLNCNHAPVARSWSIAKKRLSATVVCLNTACIGVVIGIYAGEVPAIQYVVIDLDHTIILGNVVLFLGIMVSTALLWPLPLLHGRKPYNVGGLMLALCLQVPQGLSVITVRLPSTVSFKWLLLLARGLSGMALGLCDMNLQATLLDLFGASLQSHSPHQEIVDLMDVRRHGGGMGLWLGIWSWCSIGPLSIGFMIGALIISNATVD